MNQLSLSMFQKEIPKVGFYNHNTYELRPTLYKNIFIGKMRTNIDEGEIERAFLKIGDRIKLITSFSGLSYE